MRFHGKIFTDSSFDTNNAGHQSQHSHQKAKRKNSFILVGM